MALVSTTGHPESATYSSPYNPATSSNTNEALSSQIGSIAESALSNSSLTATTPPPTYSCGDYQNPYANLLAQISIPTPSAPPIEDETLIDNTNPPSNEASQRDSNTRSTEDYQGVIHSSPPSYLEATEDWEHVDLPRPTDIDQLSNILLATFLIHKSDPENFDYSINYADMLIEIVNANQEIIDFKELISRILEKPGATEKLGVDLTVIFLSKLVKCIAVKAELGEVDRKTPLKEDLEAIVDFAATDTGFLCPPPWIHYFKPEKYGTEVETKEIFLQNFLEMVLKSTSLPALTNRFIEDGSLDQNLYLGRMEELEGTTSTNENPISAHSNAITAIIEQLI